MIARSKIRNIRTTRNTIFTGAGVRNIFTQQRIVEELMADRDGFVGAVKLQAGKILWSGQFNTCTP